MDATTSCRFVSFVAVLIPKAADVVVVVFATMVGAAASTMILSKSPIEGLRLFEPTVVATEPVAVLLTAVVSCRRFFDCRCWAIDGG